MARSYLHKCNCILINSHNIYKYQYNNTQDSHQYSDLLLFVHNRLRLNNRFMTIKIVLLLYLLSDVLHILAVQITTENYFFCSIYTRFNINSLFKPMILLKINSHLNMHKELIFNLKLENSN